MGSRFDRHSPALRAQRWHKQKFVLLRLAFFLQIGNVTPAEVNNVRRVLVFNDFDPVASPGVALLDQAIFTSVSQSRYQIEWYDENLGANLFTDEASQRNVRELYINKYDNHKLNLIIAVGPTSLQFMIESHERFFPGIPIIFCGSSEEMLERLKPDSHFTGVWGTVQPEETFKAALHLQPTSKHVVVVGGVGAYDRYLERIVKGSLQNYESKFEFTYLTDQDMPTLLGRLSRLPSDTIVLYTSIFQDAAGAHFIDANQSAPTVVGATNAPVFVLFDVNFGTGTVGGDIISFASDGKIAGQMAVSILNGEKLGNIPVVKNANVMMFDWRALRRWGFKESDLPPGSVVSYRQLTVWESYKWYIISGISLILSEALLIGGLVWQRAERLKSEKAERASKERLRLAQQAARIGTFEWNIQTGVNTWTPELEGMYGLPPSGFGGTQTAFENLVHPDDRTGVIELNNRALKTGNPTKGEWRVVWPDGSVHWIAGRWQVFMNESGEPSRMIGVNADVTEGKVAEEALRETEDKLRLLLDSTAEAIYGIDLEHRCTFCNPACLRILGYEHIDQVLGKNTHDLIHHTRSDGTLFPVEECRVHRVTRTGEGVHAEDEVFWRANGTSFPAEYWSYPQRRGKEIVGAVVAFVDITERKLAEAALANLSRKLIEAQEQERTRIGRELHDDIGQRLSMVAIELQQLHEDPLDLSEVRNRTGQLLKQITEIADDIQSLSHGLHSAKLQYLGIAGAIRSFCQEFSEQQKVEIDFNVHDLPRPLSPDISLCLFRVLQEALHNSAKHSGVRQFEVRLWATSDEIHLTVKDSGAGFDREAAKESRGLGLISMEERLKVLNGALSIDSQPKRGTTIHARVPFDSSGDSMRAAG